MSRIRRVAVVLCAIALLLPGSVLAVTREIADERDSPLTFRRSVINQLTHDLFWDPYDELGRRPFNLPFVNIDRHGNLSPWPDQEGDHRHYVNALVGNNGNTNVQQGSDVFSGAYIRQPGSAFNWGISASLFADDNENTGTNPVDSIRVTNSLTGYDLRFAAAYVLNESFTIGGGIDLSGRDDEETASSFELGIGGFNGTDEVTRSGFGFDVGVRHFLDERSSWQAQLIYGNGSTEQNEFAESLDDTGAIVARTDILNYDITDTTIVLGGAYNRRFQALRGEWQAGLTLGQIESSLDNSDLAFDEGGPLVTLLGQDAVTETSIVASFGSINLAGPSTQVFTGAELTLSTLDGSTEIGDGVNTSSESIDDTLTALGLKLGIRQPLGTDKLRLIASTRADFLDREMKDVFDASTSTDGSTRTTTEYAIGVEGVFLNMTFDLAWRFGEEVALSPAPGESTGLSRRVIEFDRLIAAAIFAW
ncbi:MAG TPA: hypothetical protein VD788_02030 [Candidatus Polarisedimenticolaceae bacterium]|nr:hypothetical protein [Candidatus Polarisedimenticolaceae bacterium]